MASSSPLSATAPQKRSADSPPNGSHHTKSKPHLMRAVHHGAMTDDIPHVLRCAVGNKLISSSTADGSESSIETNPVALFYDLDAFDDTLDALKDAFPGDGWRHCLAVKANPLLRMLQMAVAKGFGLECASLSEVELSVRAQCPPHMIVYDSPCKTLFELRRSLQLGVHINCDGFEEIQRIARILVEEKMQTRSTIGVRVNPLLGMGQIKALSVSDATSKFGIPLTAENEKDIMQCFAKYEFLSALHVHVGSQGCSLEMLSTGALMMLKLAERLGGSKRIKVLDVGGGLPTNFSSDETRPSFHDYAEVMKKIVPELFTPESGYICVTEFGRAVQAKLGWVASACELVKEAGGRRIAVVHVGSDMFVRTCYCPNDFPLRVQVISGKDFHLKHEEDIREQNVVGPLCFGGDKICEAAMLPRIDENDFVVVRDSGANCLSLWSRHCSRPSPPVYGFRQRNDGVYDFLQLRKKETLDQVLAFWQ